MLHHISTSDTVGQWDQLFSSEELDQILELCKTLDTEVAHVGFERNEETTDPAVRNSKIAWLYRDNNTQWIFDRYDGAVQRLNSSFFGVDVEPLTMLQFTIYNDDGGQYNWHWDMQMSPPASHPKVIRQRKISVVTQLNDPEEYEGGVLQLAPCGSTIDVEKEKGKTFMFLSFVNHRVTPVTSGTRYSLVGWFEGPDWR